MATSYAPTMQQQLSQQSHHSRQSQQQQLAFHSTRLPVDTKLPRSYYDGDVEQAAADNSAMDSGLEHSPHMGETLSDNFGVTGTPLFSPASKADDWSAVDMQSQPSNNPFFTQQQQQQFAEGLMSIDENDAADFDASNPWMLPAGQFMLDNNGFPFVNGAIAFNPHGNVFAGQEKQQRPNIAPAASGTPGQVFPQSRSSGAGRPKKAPPMKPAQASSGGIRKKNARVDIPDNFTTDNIDGIIDNEKDPDTKKYYRHLKRLLRNRQAALDSRNRKKAHTAQLEDDRKHLTDYVTEQDDEIRKLRLQVEYMWKEKQDATEYIAQLSAERDNLIAAHTLETGELRKKIAVLTEHVHRIEGDPPTSTIPETSTGGFDHMNDFVHGWDDVNSFGDNYPSQPQVKPEAPKARPANNAVASDKGIAQHGNFFFMLFLVGAFVLSRQSAPAIPPVSDAVRSASANLLDNVFKDAGVSTQTVEAAPAAPQASGTWNDSLSGMPVPEVGADTVSPSMLDNLVQPTVEQTNEQIFSLSTLQYANAQDDAYIDNSGLEHRPRRSLADVMTDALAAVDLSDAPKDAVADVYSRSLLWEQIPRKVVQDFARYVVASNSRSRQRHDGQQQQHQHHYPIAQEIS